MHDLKFIMTLMGVKCCFMNVVVGHTNLMEALLQV